MLNFLLSDFDCAGDRLCVDVGAAVMVSDAPTSATAAPFLRIDVDSVECDFVQGAARLARREMGVVLQTVTAFAVRVATVVVVRMVSVLVMVGRAASV